MESPVKLGGRRPRRSRRRPSARSVKPMDYDAEQDGGVWPFTPSRRSTRVVSFDDLTTEKTPLRPRASASVSKRSQRYTAKVAPGPIPAKRSRLATTESQTLQQEYLNQLELAEAELARIQQTIKAAKEAGKTSPNKGTVLSTLLVLNESILIQLMKRMKSMDESTQKPFIGFLTKIYDRLKTLESVATKTIVNKDLENRILLNRHIVGVFLGKESASSGEQLGAGIKSMLKKFITACSGGLCRRVEVESPKVEAEPPKQASLFEIIKSSLEDYGKILNVIGKNHIELTNEKIINKKRIILMYIRNHIWILHNIPNTINKSIEIGVDTQQVPLTSDQKTLLNDSIQGYITRLETLKRSFTNNDTNNNTKTSIKTSIEEHINKLNKIKEKLTSTTSVRRPPSVSAAPASNKKNPAASVALKVKREAVRSASSRSSSSKLTPPEEEVLAELDKLIEEEEKPRSSPSQSFSSKLTPSEMDDLAELDKLIKEEEKPRSSPGTSSRKTGGRKKATRVKRI